MSIKEGRACREVLLFSMGLELHLENCMFRITTIVLFSVCVF